MARKPLLILPPAPTRWPALRERLGHKGPLWLADIEQRLTGAVTGSRDALAVVADGGRVLATTIINARQDVGVLGHVFTDPAQRGQGLARRTIETVLSWFDMTGGRWLYLGCHRDLAPLYEKFGFHTLHTLSRGGVEDCTMQRRAPDTPITPQPVADAPERLRHVERADWPLLVALLQDQPGPDPRVPLAESAVAAELSMLELLSQQEAGKCHLLALEHADRIVGLGSLATAAPGEATYAALLPHNRRSDDLRAALEDEARQRGYQRVDYPLEALDSPPPPPPPPAAEA